jgi:hypothetical protein
VDVSGCCHDANINAGNQSIKNGANKKALLLAYLFETGDYFAMSNRETVIEFVRKLPEEMPMAEIAREIELLAGIQTAREQARRGDGIPAEDARKLVDAWASK